MQKEHKEKIIAGGKFFLSLFIIFAVLYTTIDFYLVGVELIYANITNSLLQLLDLNGEIIVKASEKVVWLALPKLTIQISFLCTGLIELFILWAAIASSFGIAKEKRIIGMLQSTAIVLIFNIARILTSTFLLLGTGIEFADLAHDLLFRLSLFVVIAGFYGWWLYSKHGFYQK